MSALPSAQRPLNLRDVAEASGCSKATVCKVASGNFPVSDHTREIIERAAADIGYVWKRDRPRPERKPRRRRPRPKPRPKPAPRPPRSKISARLHLVDLRAALAVESMPRDDVVQYELESVIALSSYGVADEDHDPTPVPRGCPGCWRRDGSDPCINCPSPPSEQDRRSRGAYRVALPS